MNNANHSHLGRYVVAPPVLHTEETIVSQDVEPNRNEDLPIDGDVLLPRVLTVGDGAPLPPSVFGFSTSFPSGSKSITYYERRVPSFTVYGSSRYMEEDEYEEEGEQKVGGWS
ncbi:hypothetical protein ADEAN_000120500 [Angomonas deanei]|uniref:Uncharacterized protein n=1 Tax=Angomonas deanei TaxID=59799 RepID=A0A7G2C732_9TRYP|nr:hypothetical protein ADEAN_000120500 [Angomonas deanei]